MLELRPDNAATYLGLPPSETRVTELGGGVSNIVLLVEAPGRRLVLKQSLDKLRVEQDWFSDRGRILRECLGLEAFHAMMAGSCPRVLAVDRENFAYTMTAAPPASETWKAMLMRGDLQPAVARRVGELLGRLIQQSWRSERYRDAFGDQTVFDQLRLDPYYRSAARVHPDLAGFFESLILRTREHARSLVHGDWSPKNFLVAGSVVTAIDFEVIHYGDPCFDAAFLLNHLLLKSFHLPACAEQFAPLGDAFWKAVISQVPEEQVEFSKGTIAHLGGLMLARVDGKSPAEYLDNAARDQVRRFARALIASPPKLEELWSERMAWR